jgi:hypothetical protein
LKIRDKEAPGAAPTARYFGHDFLPCGELQLSGWANFGAPGMNMMGTQIIGKFASS